MKHTENLERSYILFIEKEKPFDFFKGLISYLDYIFSTPILKKEFDKQLEERRVLYKQIEDLEQNIRKELHGVKVSLFNVIKKNKINPEFFKRHRTTFISDNSTNLIQEIESYEKGEVVHGIFVSDNISDCLFDITANILDAGYKEEIREYIIEEKPQSYLFIFINFFEERNKKIEQFEKERAFKHWGSFEALLQFKIASESTANLKQMPEGIENESWFGEIKERLKIYELAKELKNLTENEMDFYSQVNSHHGLKNNNTLKYLNREVFKNNTEIVHSHILKNITENKTDVGSTYITKKSDDFKYKGKLLALSKKADYYKVFCALYALLPSGGEVKYKDLIKEIKSRIPKTKSKSEEEMRKFIQANLTEKGNGFLRYAKVSETEDNSKPLISVNKGSGINFNNKAG